MRFDELFLLLKFFERSLTLFIESKFINCLMNDYKVVFIIKYL